MRRNLEITDSTEKQFQKKEHRDFPGGPVVQNPPSNAGDVGSIPAWGTKILHAVGQLSPCSTTTELVCLNERVRVPQTTEPTHHNYGVHRPWTLCHCHRPAAES